MMEKPGLVLMEVEPVCETLALVSSSVKWAEDNQPSRVVESWPSEGHGLGGEWSMRPWRVCVCMRNGAQMFWVDYWSSDHVHRQGQCLCGHLLGAEGYRQVARAETDSSGSPSLSRMALRRAQVTLSRDREALATEMS